MLEGLMQNDYKLTVGAIRRRMRAIYGDREVVTLQITYIVNHAEDGVVFVDDSLAPPLAKLANTFEGTPTYVVMGDGDDGGLSGAVRYEDLLEGAGPGEYAWPEVDERAAAALC